MTDASQASGMKQKASDEWNRHAYRYISGLGLIFLAMGTVVYHFIEDWSWVDSFYFSSVALTTVGFGDLTPSTDASKLFTVFYIFSGVSLIGAVLNAFLKRHAARAGHRRSSED